MLEREDIFIMSPYESHGLGSSRLSPEKQHILTFINCCQDLEQPRNSPAVTTLRQLVGASVRHYVSSALQPATDSHTVALGLVEYLRHPDKAQNE